MDFDYLFNKNDALTLAVIRQLNTNATNTITKNTLIAEYNLTAYQQNRLFDAINAAFQAVGGEPPCYLEETTKDLWRAHHLTTYCVQQVTLWLLEQSAAFKVLNYYCFESNAQTTAAYAKNHYLTEAVFFRQTKVLKQNSVKTSVGLIQNSVSSNCASGCLGCITRYTPALPRRSRHWRIR
ncbi:hypothetical protein [Lacticaseibacillus nasuensis]|uniref:hypothetical protein n=1 Tax=Lacticaseibacillus nasuensis TaxID=944671 RepID=UPI0006CF6CC5|nr:hypothetical protein [Lacticaseibacillus nasuensis]